MGCCVPASVTRYGSFVAWTATDVDFRGYFARPEIKANTTLPIVPAPRMLAAHSAPI